jgi:hypothetical protein
MENIGELEDKHKLHVYEGIGHMIHKESDFLKQEVLLKNLMQYTGKDWS